MICGIVVPTHYLPVVIADILFCRRASGRSSLSGWSQRSSGSSVFSRRTDRTSASSVHSDMPYTMSYTESSGPAPHVPNTTRQRPPLPPLPTPVSILSDGMISSRQHGQGYRGASVHVEPSGPAPNFYETRRLQQEFESQLQGRFSGAVHEHGRATRASRAWIAIDEVRREMELENEPRSSSA